MGFKAPNYTKTPNELFDTMMKDLSHAELLVTMCAIRKTFGWQKTQDAISYTQFEEMTGLSRKAVSSAIKSLLKKNILNKVGTGKRNIGIYELVVEDDSTLVTEGNQLPEDTRTGYLDTLELVTEGNTQKKALKKEKETTTAVVGDETTHVFKHFASVFSLYVNDKKYQASKQPAKDMQALDDLIEAYGHDSVNLAIEKCIGVHPSKPLPYMTSICRSQDHKDELVKRNQQASVITPYHQPAIIEDETLLSDDDVQSFLDELKGAAS